MTSDIPISATAPGDMAQKETSGKAVASLVFGILGITQFLPCVGPIVAIVLGAGETDGVGRAGLILGWITLAIYAAVALLALVFLGVGGWTMLEGH
jgi:cytochrome c biogenesis protein CcdA